MTTLKHSSWVYLLISVERDNLQPSIFGRGNGKLTLQLRFCAWPMNTINALD